MTDDLTEFYAQLRRWVGRVYVSDAAQYEAEILRALLDHTETLERRLLTLERAAGPWDGHRRLHPVTGAVMATVTPDGDLWRYTLHERGETGGWSMTGFATYDDAVAGADREMRERGWALVGEP